MLDWGTYKVLLLHNLLFFIIDFNGVHDCYTTRYDYSTANLHLLPSFSTQIHAALYFNILSEFRPIIQYVIKRELRRRRRFIQCEHSTWYITMKRKKQDPRRHKCPVDLKKCIFSNVENAQKQRYPAPNEGIHPCPAWKRKAKVQKEIIFPQATWKSFLYATCQGIQDDERFNYKKERVSLEQTLAFHVGSWRCLTGLGAENVFFLIPLDIAACVLYETVQLFSKTTTSMKVLSKMILETSVLKNKCPNWLNPTRVVESAV